MESPSMVSKTIYKVTAAYTGKFKTSEAAKSAFSKMKANPRAKVTPVKKTANGYGFIVKFMFITPSAKVKDHAVNAAKARGARVSVSSRKA